MRRLVDTSDRLARGAARFEHCRQGGLPFGEDDLTRINTTTRVIAVDMPNTQSANALEWYDYRTSVDAIEDSTGLDGLNALGTDLQELLEMGVDAGPVN